MTLADDDTQALNLALGQVHHMLGEVGATDAQALVASASLELRRDGGFYHPVPGDDWDEPSYEAVLCVDPVVVDEFTVEVQNEIWSKVRAVLRGRGRHDVFSLSVEASVPPLPEVTEDWRTTAVQILEPDRPVNQGRAERADPNAIEVDGLRFRTPGEAVVYELLCELQHEGDRANTIATVPGSGVRLREWGTRTPDFIVIGNGRAAVIEVDGGVHAEAARKAYDATRDRHWNRCGVFTVRIPDEHKRERDALRELLREELRRHLWRPR